MLPDAQELAARLAAGPTVAYAAIKRQLAAPTSGTLDEALAVEALAQADCGRTEDHRSATEAFTAKQRPVFVGH